MQLQTLLRESGDNNSIRFLENLNNAKENIILNAKNNPNELIKWLYENQGEPRFDAANRLFLILTDMDNLFDSWKLKRNIPLLTEKINEKLDSMTTDNIQTVDFYWSPTNMHYIAKADVIFIDRS